VHLLIILPIAAIMCLGPFFAPFVGVKIAQREAWDHRCGPNDIEVVLEGPRYDLPTQSPVASFWGPGDNRTKFYSYSMALDADKTLHFRQDSLPVDAANRPFSLSVTDISYFDNHTFAARCGDVGCYVGSVNDTGRLGLDVTDTHTWSQTVTRFRAIDDQWAPTPADDAPNFLLKQVKPDGSLGDPVLHTVVTNHCTQLKMCWKTKESVDPLLAAVGLALSRQAAYSLICTIPNSN